MNVLLLIALLLVAGCAAWLWWLAEGYQEALRKERGRNVALMRQIQAYRIQAENTWAELAHIHRINREGHTR